MTDEAGLPPVRVGSRATAASGVVVRNVNKKFVRRGGEIVSALTSISLELGAGEFAVLLGPSGCGKSTLLRCVAGLETPDSGEIEISGERVFATGERRIVRPEHRDVGMMFQSYALWPHMTVRKNIAYPLEARRLKREEVRRRVDRIIDKVGIRELANEYPSRLSGGQQQRVALCRSLVAEPGVLLFDEPLSSLDAKVRRRLRQEIVEMQREFKFAAIFVTHDQDEAMDMADRLIVMQGGEAVQMGSPRGVYEKPATRYVAGFLGTLSDFRGQVKDIQPSGNGVVVRVSSPLGELRVDQADAHALELSDDVWVGIRPENVNLSLTAPIAVSGVPVENLLRGTVMRATFFGNHFEYLVKVADLILEAWGTAEDRCVAGDEVWVQLRIIQLFRQ